MPIGGNNDTFSITGAKLKVEQGVQVGGSITYTDNPIGFGSVTAQIDNDNTLNITSGKNTGVAKIERTTAATITAINHTNVNNNTTIHIALKNDSSANGSNGGIFITLGTFSNDDKIKVNYTDDYVISPQETGMITLRKVNNVLSVFIREMFTTDSKTFDSTKNQRRAAPAAPRPPRRAARAALREPATKHIPCLLQKTQTKQATKRNQKQRRRLPYLQAWVLW